MKPIKLDIVSSSRGRRRFIVSGGQNLDEQGQPLDCHACLGVFGLIILGENRTILGVVATNNLYENAETYGRVLAMTLYHYVSWGQMKRTVGL
jgi:hypothetical protein